MNALPLKNSRFFTVFWVLFFRGIGAVLQFLLNILLGRVLGPQGIGIYYLYVSWMVVLTDITGLGLPTYTLRQVSALEGTGNRDRANSFVLNALKTGAAACLMVVLPVFFLSSYVSELFLGNRNLEYVIQTVCFSSLLFLMLKLLSEALKALGKPNLGIIGEFSLLPAGLMAAAALCLFFNLDILPRDLLRMHLGILGITALAILMIWLRQSRTKICLKSFQSVPVLNPSLLPFWGGTFLNVAFVNMPILLLPYFASPDEIGIFGVAYRLMGLATTILVALAGYFGPRFSRHNALNDAHALSKELRLSQLYSFFAYLPFLTVFIFFSKPVLSIFGPEFQAGTLILRILALGQLVNACTGLVGYLLNMINREKIEFFTLGGAVIFMFGLSVLMGMKYGLTGVAIAYSFSLALKNIVSYFLSLYFLKNLKNA